MEMSAQHAVPKIDQMHFQSSVVSLQQKTAGTAAPAVQPSEARQSHLKTEDTTDTEDRRLQHMQDQASTKMALRKTWVYLFNRHGSDQRLEDLQPFRPSQLRFARAFWMRHHAQHVSPRTADPRDVFKRSVGIGLRCNVPGRGAETEHNLLVA